MWGQKRRKDRKTRNSRSEEKIVGFSPTFLFHAKKWDAVTQDGIRRIDHLTPRRAQGAGVFKDWEDKRECGRIPDTFL